MKKTPDLFSYIEQRVLGRLPSNTLTSLHFDYTFFTQYSKAKKIQATQKKIAFAFGLTWTILA